MNYAPLLFLGAFLTFASAWIGLVYAPSYQLKDLQPQAVEGTTLVNPRPYSGQEQRGRAVYLAEGCVYCHSQQVRGGAYNSDTLRGWGRRSAPIDYIHDYPVLLGTMRTGPDLFNVGTRYRGEDGARWHYLHLYNPQKMTQDSIMAPYSYLFEKRKIVGQPSADALKFDDKWTAQDGRPEPGWEIVPTERARALVAYLQALDHTYDLEPVPGVNP